VSVQPVERKLAAIFAADIAGYSRLMARDEVGTLAQLKACRAIIDGLIASHRGRIFNTAGDSVVADFASAVDALECAVAVQAAIATEEAGGELTQRIFDALREQGEIASADVAVQAMRDKGLDAENDPATRTDFVRRVGLQLNDMARKGKVERTGKGRALRWRLNEVGTPRASPDPGNFT
jgi:hypothetical protein